MIVRGAMATCEHQQAVCSVSDHLALCSALSELHVLRRQWNGALDSGVDVHEILHSTYPSPTALNVLRLSAASEAALVRHIPMLDSHAIT